MLCCLGSDFISDFLFVNVGVDLQMSRAISCMRSVAKGSTSWLHVPRPAFQAALPDRDTFLTYETAQLYHRLGGQPNPAGHGEIMRQTQKPYVYRCRIRDNRT